MSYLEQLDAACAAAGIRLEDACKAEGLADTTLARWRKGAVTPREATARALFSRIEAMTAQSVPAE